MYVAIRITEQTVFKESLPFFIKPMITVGNTNIRRWEYTGKLNWRIISLS